MGPIRRRTYIVDKKLQYRLLGYNAIYFFITLAALSLALFTPLIFEIADPTLSPRQQAEVAGKILYLHSYLWPALFLVLVILGFHSVLVSNKIAGPLYRFRSTFQKIIEGDISGSVKIRKGDLLINEQTKIDEMISLLNSKIGQIQVEGAAVGELLAKIYGQELNADQKAVLARIQEHCERLKKEADFFKTA
jgi:nitrogen fixation/metabolism regulation signal transduction histidine kinase